jgi:hypothetical protein
VTFQYEHGSSVHDFFRTNPGAELAHWREGQRECANSAEFQTTENFVSMAHSSSDDSDDDDYSLPSEDEDSDSDYVDYVEIAMPGRQSFLIPRRVPDGGDAQEHRPSTSRAQSAFGSHSHAGGEGDHVPYDKNVLVSLHSSAKEGASHKASGACRKAKKRTTADQKISAGAGAGADSPRPKRNRNAASYSTARPYCYTTEPKNLNFKRNKAGSNQHSTAKEGGSQEQGNIFTTETGTHASWKRWGKSVTTHVNSCISPCRCLSSLFAYFSMRYVV